MNQREDDLSWDGVDPEMAQRILQQGEIFLSVQLQVALASDSRSITVASVFTALGTAVIAAALVYWAEEKNTAILISGVATGMIMILGACVALWTARPIDFYFPGNHPSQWWDCRTDDFVRALGGETENYQARIEANEQCLAANADTLNRGALVAVCAPVVGLLIWLVVTFFWFQKAIPPVSPA